VREKLKTKRAIKASRKKEIKEVISDWSKEKDLVGALFGYKSCFNWFGNEVGSACGRSKDKMKITQDTKSQDVTGYR
jgi:hypothetical protein